MDHNFNIANFFNALKIFKAIVGELRQTMTDAVERKRLKIIMGMAKKDIEEMFNQVGKEE